MCCCCCCCCCCCWLKYCFLIFFLSASPVSFRSECVCVLLSAFRSKLEYFVCLFVCLFVVYSPSQAWGSARLVSTPTCWCPLLRPCTQSSSLTTIGRYIYIYATRHLVVVLLLHSGRCYEAEICTILFLLRCPFIWYPFWPKSKFSDFGQKPWTIIRRFCRNRGDFLRSFYSTVEGATKLKFVPFCFS